MCVKDGNFVTRLFDVYVIITLPFIVILLVLPSRKGVAFSGGARTTKRCGSGSEGFGSKPDVQHC
jgi:hypothetical protein